jgi:hypothetical protein
VKNQGLGASFTFHPMNQGVVASLWLELDNSWSFIFLQVGSCKQGIVASFHLQLENWEVGVSYERIIDIYIRKNYVVLSHLGFHVNTGIMCS